MTDEARMQRLVSGAAARDQPHLALLQKPALYEEPTLAHRDDVGMRSAESREALIYDGARIVDELLHG